MLKYKKTLIFLAVILITAFYLFWPGLAPDLSSPPALHIKVSASYGRDTGRGNVVGIEPYMEQLDYATPERFEAKLAGYLDVAASKGWLREGTIVLLPEHIGTWLLASGQGSRVLDAETAADAALPLITHHLFAYLKNLYIFDSPDNRTAALIRARTETVATAQYKVYASLAKRFGVTLVAGSSAIMTPGVYPDTLSYGHGPIFNAGFVFGPNGKPIEDAVRKVHPIPREHGFTKASKAEFLPTFTATPGGRFGVLICADSWFEDTTSHLAREGARLLLVPAFLTGTGWDDPWRGYIGDTPPQDTWRQDIDRISEGDAWVKYAMPATARAHGIEDGMTVFLKGNLWGESGSGRALILDSGALHIGAGGDDGAALYNLWLGD